MGRALLLLVLLIAATPLAAQERRGCLTRVDAQYRRDLADPGLGRAGAERRRVLAMEACDDAAARERAAESRRDRERRVEPRNRPLPRERTPR
jgi:hypothetical protein